MYYVYVLKSKKDSKLYTGYTNDLQKRFNEHNNGKVFSTKNRGPFEIIYYEACHNDYDARAREKYLKSGLGKSYLRKRLKRFLFQTGFTLLEILIVIAILAVLSGIAVGFYRNYAINSESNLTKKTIISNLKQARAKSIAGEGGLKWGVHFVNNTDDYYEIFSTPTDYSSASTTIFSIIYFSKMLSFSEPISSSTVIFNKISGVIDATSSVIFSSDVDTNTVTITPSGNIY